MIDTVNIYFAFRSTQRVRFVKYHNNNYQFLYKCIKSLSFKLLYLNKSVLYCMGSHPTCNRIFGIQ